MTKLSKDDRNRIRDAIRQAEAGTSGEFVAVLARRSDHYIFIPILWAAIIALLVPGIFLLAELVSNYMRLYQFQLLLFIVLAIVFQYQPIKMRLIPQRVKFARAARLAYEQFYLQGVHRTRENSGVLFFVSVAEQYVQIVADQGIHENVGDEGWKKIIAEFTDNVRLNKFAEGFGSAIRECGRLMATHYPRRPDDTDELTDELIEL